MWSTTPLDPHRLQAGRVRREAAGCRALASWSGGLTGTTVATATFIIHPDGRVVAAPRSETFPRARSPVRGPALLDSSRRPTAHRTARLKSTRPSSAVPAISRAPRRSAPRRQPRRAAAPAPEPTQEQFEADHVSLTKGGACGKGRVDDERRLDRSGNRQPVAGMNDLPARAFEPSAPRAPAHERAERPGRGRRRRRIFIRIGSATGMPSSPTADRDRAEPARRRRCSRAALLGLAGRADRLPTASGSPLEQLLMQVVNALKGHNALGAWKGADEPLHGNVRPRPSCAAIGGCAHSIPVTRS